MYLSATNTALSPSSLWTTPLRHPLASFIPQLGLSILLGFMFGSQDLAFAWFIQTWVFVALNKVCTSQASFSTSSSLVQLADFFVS